MSAVKEKYQKGETQMTANYMWCEMIKGQEVGFLYN